MLCVVLCGNDVQKIKELLHQFEALQSVIDSNNPNYPQIASALDRVHSVHRRMHTHVVDKNLNVKKNIIIIKIAQDFNSLSLSFSLSSIN